MVFGEWVCTPLLIFRNLFFVFIYLIFRYPESINRLLVIDPGGMFPIQCKEGAFMAILFKWGVPMFFLRSLGR